MKSTDMNIKEKSNRMTQMVTVIGIFVLAFTKMNAMDTLRLIAQILVLMGVIAGIIAIIKWILNKIKKKESKMITNEEIINAAVKKSAM